MAKVMSGTEMLGWLKTLDKETLGDMLLCDTQMTISTADEKIKRNSHIDKESYEKNGWKRFIPDVVESRIYSEEIIKNFLETSPLMKDMPKNILSQNILSVLNDNLEEDCDQPRTFKPSDDKDAYIDIEYRLKKMNYEDYDYTDFTDILAINKFKFVGTQKGTILLHVYTSKLKKSVRRHKNFLCDNYNGFMFRLFFHEMNDYYCWKFKYVYEVNEWSVFEIVNDRLNDKEDKNIMTKEAPEWLRDDIINVEYDSLEFECRLASDNYEDKEIRAVESPRFEWDEKRNLLRINKDDLKAVIDNYKKEFGNDYTGFIIIRHTVSCDRDVPEDTYYNYKYFCLEDDFVVFDKISNMLKDCSDMVEIPSCAPDWIKPLEKNNKQNNAYSIVDGISNDIVISL